MDTFSRIQMIFVPLWVKAILFAVVLGSFGASVYLFYAGVVLDDQADWIAAAASLGGVVFPTLVLFILLSGSSGGEASIREKTDTLLRRTIPTMLAKLPETFGPFATFDPATERLRRGAPAKADSADVHVRHLRGRCYADYRIRFRDAAARLNEVVLRVEANVRRVNLILMFDEAMLEAYERNLDGAMTRSEVIFAKFRHSAIAVETHSKTLAGAAQAGEAASPLIYAFNSELLTMHLEGRPYAGLVANTHVSADMVWNPAERLFFAQDLMFMLRSFVRFGDELFLIEDPKAAPDQPEERR